MNTELITKYDMLPQGCKVLCAVSGGADSMCLLHWLYSQAERLNITVCAAHFEHGLRGEESLRDCRFVEDFCREHGIELAVEHGDVNRFAAVHGMSTEEAARELRYDFLRRAAARFGQQARVLRAGAAEFDAHRCRLSCPAMISSRVRIWRFISPSSMWS